MINFPDAPTVGQVWPGPNGVSYKWTGVAWTGTVTGSGGGGGATGGGTDQVFHLNDQQVTTDYSITEDKHAGTFGPITINDGVSVTIPDDSVWSIV